MRNREVFLVFQVWFEYPKPITSRPATQGQTVLHDGGSNGWVKAPAWHPSPPIMPRPFFRQFTDNVSGPAEKGRQAVLDPKRVSSACAFAGGLLMKLTRMRFGTTSRARAELRDAISPSYPGGDCFADEQSTNSHFTDPSFTSRDKMRPHGFFFWRRGKGKIAAFGDGSAPLELTLSRQHEHTAPDQACWSATRWRDEGGERGSRRHGQGILRTIRH
ncbi:hypothetical protein N658DRAFT_345308 [Parathielavia hyrcaniae]|uniref:Uncharacterized protein n=1 Tax=Parathielavia hyrcaniae TaxID=113614 RepID=A0AAN6Q324_9PEZI|nr:hypothetical protein N658DRAFT_345308 [Parathielavia hyrcaniae]